MKWSESEIQTLKAQEAKDLAVKLLQELQARDRGPISAGEVQIKELDFQLQLREAEVEDNRRREAHERKIKELELQIEQERARCVEAANQADQVRGEYAAVIERVTVAGESLSIQLERATREHNLKIEQLEATFTKREAELAKQIDEFEQRRNSIREEIDTLTGIRDDALELAQLREEIERKLKESQQEEAQLEEQLVAAEFEKTKKINNTKRAQELELARLEAEHQKNVLQQNLAATESILDAAEKVAVDKGEWNRLHEELQSAKDRTQHEENQIRDVAREEFRREWNITRPEPVDVTDLYYREQAANAERERLRGQVDKLEGEIRRMREHIEHEPQRISTAVEAAKTSVQNYIEQGGKR
jgi:chromosome segregation ATPase